MEETAPRGVAEDGDERSAGAVFLGKEEAAIQRLGAEEAEEGGGRAEDVDVFGTVGGDERARHAARDRHVVEGSLLVFDLEVLGWRRPVLGDVVGGDAEPESGETVGVGVGEGAEKEGADDAEDGSVGGYPYSFGPIPFRITSKVA